MKKSVIITLLIIIIGLIIYNTFIRKYPILDPIINYEYITDTLYIPKPYSVPEPYPVPTPPRIIIRYEVDSITLNYYKLKISKQNILIAGLLDTIAIHENYLKQYPSNPKFIDMFLIRDTLSLGLLQILGHVENKSWPIDLNRFDYKWDYINNLTRRDTKLPPLKEKSYVKYFGGGGVDLLWLSPYIDFTVEKELQRIRLYSNINLGLLNKNSSSIKIGIDYRFNVKDRNHIK